MNARGSSSLLTLSILTHKLFVMYLAQTWAQPCSMTSPAEPCPHRSSPVCIASYIGHSAGEIDELAEAADEVDGNEGILGRNHIPKHLRAGFQPAAPTLLFLLLHSPSQASFEHLETTRAGKAPLQQPGGNHRRAQPHNQPWAAATGRTHTHSTVWASTESQSLLTSQFLQTGV